MFLSAIRRRNPALLEAARELHAKHLIGPDTYVIDQDAVSANARHLAEASAAHGVELWFVTKQLGRVGPLTAAVSMHIPRATAIDVREARAVLRAGAGLGNVGHLVQIPQRALPDVLAARPEYVTVFDLANMRAVAEAAKSLGITQPVLLRIAGDPDVTYPGQDGGFPPDQITPVLDQASGLDSVQVAGVTGFPCLLFDGATQRVRPTTTADRVLTAASQLCDAGIDPVINMPSQSSCSTLPILAGLGATHAEPGHALTGTTPEHAADSDLKETPAFVYVSEVAQQDPQPAVFGGGFYPRGHAQHVLIGRGGHEREGTLRTAPAENIDYYRQFDLPEGVPSARVGEVAVMAFRTQMFVQRSRLAVVSGIHQGRVEMVGLFDSAGLPLPEGDL